MGMEPKVKLGTSRISVLHARRRKPVIVDTTNCLSGGRLLHWRDKALVTRRIILFQSQFPSRYHQTALASTPYFCASMCHPPLTCRASSYSFAF